MSYSLRFFPKGKVSAESFKLAVNTARSEIQRIAKLLKSTGWQLAVGTSGTARTLRDLIAAANPEDNCITPAALQKIAARLIEAGSAKKAKFDGMKADRIEVFAGGLAVMSAVFAELDIDSMTVTDAALRDGVFYDLIGRQLNEDMREQTIAHFQQRYHVSQNQAQRVAALAAQFFDMLAEREPEKERHYWQQYLRWAALVHEIGTDIAYTAYHKHSAYILEQADMPGFSRQEQQILATLVLGQRGDLRKMAELPISPTMWLAVAALRLAVLFCRARLPHTLPAGTRLSYENKNYTLAISRQWPEDNPLTAGALADDAAQWRKIGIRFGLLLQ